MNSMIDNLYNLPNDDHRERKDNLVRVWHATIAYIGYEFG